MEASIETSKSTSMEQQQAKATELLEISDGFVKCQGCGSLKPLFPPDWPLSVTGGRLAHRIAALKSTIHYGEKYHVLGSCRKEKEELRDLLKEQAAKQNDILRRLPLYSTPLSNYKWICLTCHDKLYLASRRKKAS